MRQAEYWKSETSSIVKCYLCPHHCSIPKGKVGRCRVRKNRENVLYTENYCKVTAINIDPIEKKPLYHFYPGSLVLSLGTFGCNFHCSFCQNWQIAHKDATFKELDIAQITQIAKEAQKEDDSIGIAYTYSEPLMWFEFIKDIAPKIRELGQKNILVTNGFIEEKPFKDIVPFISALNIDIKGFTNEFYKKNVKGSYEPVLRTAEIAKKKNCHVEITTLLIPGLNDSPEEITALTSWIAETLGNDTPLHFSRFFPNYKLDLEPTPIETLEKAKKIAEEKLLYVYLGNVHDPKYSSTYCPRCGELVIKRTGYATIKNLKNSTCKKCGQKLNIYM